MQTCVEQAQPTLLIADVPLSWLGTAVLCSRGDVGAVPPPQDAHTGRFSSHACSQGSDTCQLYVARCVFAGINQQTEAAMLLKYAAAGAV